MAYLGTQEQELKIPPAITSNQQQNNRQPKTWTPITWDWRRSDDLKNVTMAPELVPFYFTEKSSTLV